MKKIIIVHGWDGASDRDWMPWATAEFQKLGYEVICPDLPHAENPTIEDWVPFLSEAVGTPDENTYFIGHSIGCQTIMRYLETVNTSVGGAIFVAGWFDLENLEGPDAEAIAKPWITTPIDTDKVRKNLGFSIAILGDNDQWVPYEKTKGKFRKLLGSEVLTIPNCGHITSDDGFGSFPRLVGVAHAQISGVELLEVVNEQDEFVELETRKKIHQEGLLHREIHIWFMTPDRKIIFQHRAKDKDTYPDKLDATVGGHVDPGMSYEETALKEVAEETGIVLKKENLKFVKKMYKKSFDETTGLTNNTIRSQYVYLFEGNVTDLRVEAGKAIGFEGWSIDSLSTLSENDRKKFIPLILEKDLLDLFEEGQKMLNLK